MPSEESARSLQTD